jgi:hypothetical protein
MIVFDLKCGVGHEFEAWFRSSDHYEEQLSFDEVECPYCGSADVSKAVMAPNVGTKGNRTQHRHPAIQSSNNEDAAAQGATFGVTSLPQELQEQLDEVLKNVRSHVEDNCEYVGDRFPEEARKIYYGEAKERGIYGEATLEESGELSEEGIDVFPLPISRKAGRSDA